MPSKCPQNTCRGARAIIADASSVYALFDRGGVANNRPLVGRQGDSIMPPRLERCPEKLTENPREIDWLKQIIVAIRTIRPSQTFPGYRASRVHGQYDAGR